MQPIWPIIALALMTAACDSGGSVRITTTASGKDAPGVLKVVDALQCPQTQGVLTRKGSAVADGATCLYAGPRGAEVTLQLVKLGDRSVQAILKDFENSLSASVPQTETRIAQAQTAADQASADVAATAASSAPADARRATGDSAHVRAPGVQIDAQGDKAVIRLPGLHINADGDRADIRIGGLTIRADDRSSHVNITTDDDSVVINAADGAARVRTSAPGEAVRATFLMSADRSADGGWRTVGYEARGPAGGPVVVATVRSKDRDESRLFEAAKALVTLNVGD